jgi:hypothetical protein
MNSINLRSLAQLSYYDLITLREKAEQDVADNKCGCPTCRMYRVLSLEIIAAATHFIIRQEMSILERYPIERLLMEMDIAFYLTDGGQVFITDQSE